MILKRYLKNLFGGRDLVVSAVVNFSVRIGYVYPTPHLMGFCEDSKTMVNSQEIVNC